MDVFFEQLYKRKKGIKEILLQALIFVLTVGLSMVSFMLLAPLMYGMILGTAAIAIIVYIGYKQFIKIDIEYEYIYLNGEIDIDKIIAKSSRERLLTVKASSFDQYGEYDAAAEEKLKSVGIQKTFDFRSNMGKPLYYALFKHKTHGKTLIVFEPEDKIREDMEKYIPRQW